MPDDYLNDFDCSEFSYEGKVRKVFRIGTGPAVIVMAEVPGITPKVLEFARRVATVGCTVVIPHLFGVPGRDPNPNAHGRLATAAYLATTAVPLCVSREFITLATGRTSPVVRWLRALVAHEHERCGGPGVGAVGMCFTGGYALAMAADDRLLAPVLSQPSLPLPLTPRQRKSLDISADDLSRVKERCASGLNVLGLRFTGDKFVPNERFEFLREQLGDAFIGIELADADADPNAWLAPHSVVTEHLIDEPGEPTRVALDRVLDFLRQRLIPDHESDADPDAVD